MRNALIASSSAWPQARPSWISFYEASRDDFSDWTAGSGSWAPGMFRLSFMGGPTHCSWELHEPSSNMPVSTHPLHIREGLPFRVLSFWCWFPIMVLVSSPLLMTQHLKLYLLVISVSVFKPTMILSKKELLCLFKTSMPCCFIQWNYLWVGHLYLFFVYGIFY